jgi:hypothetical protein
VFALAAAYLSVLAFTPAFHHDFLCHLKAPTHCEACTANPAASEIDQDPPLDSVRWLAAERLDIPDPRPTPLAAPLARAGRAPPA